MPLLYVPSQTFEQVVHSLSRACTAERESARDSCALLPARWLREIPSWYTPALL